MTQTTNSNAGVDRKSAGPVEKPNSGLLAALEDQVAATAEVNAAVGEAAEPDKLTAGPSAPSSRLSASGRTQIPCGRGTAAASRSRRAGTAWDGCSTITAQSLAFPCDPWPFPATWGRSERGQCRAFVLGPGPGGAQWRVGAFQRERAALAGAPPRNSAGESPKDFHPQLTAHARQKTTPDSPWHVPKEGTEVMVWHVT